MRSLLGFAMICNSAVFFFCAAQHLGAAIGPFREPRIIPATIVETLCGLVLVWGAAAVFSQSGSRWRVALTANLVVLGGVSLGIIAMVMRFGRDTAIHDLCHRTMLVLIVASLLILFFGRSALRS
jgi:hypothetical protein